MDNLRTSRPFGLWDSPVTPAVVAAGIRITDVRWSPDGHWLVWREERSGRGVLVGQTGTSAPRDLTETLSVRARVGYGGGDFAVANDFVVFVDQASGRLFRQPLAGGSPRPITPAFGRSASPAIAPDGRSVLFVHSYERRDVVGIVDAEGRHWPQIVASGHDFFMDPTWSPDGKRVAWCAWNHPKMPWDGSFVWVADVASQRDERLPELAGAPRAIAGGDEMSVSQPVFTHDGASIVVVSDASGWGRVTTVGAATGEWNEAAVGETEFGAPAWIQGIRTFSLTPDPSVAFAVASKRGFHQIARVHLPSGGVDPLNLLSGATCIEQPAANPVTGTLAVIASSPVVPQRLVVVEPDGSERIVRRTSSENVPASQLAYPEAVTWTSRDGAVVHGLLYEPVSDVYQASGRPPLVVVVHGGPTSQSVATWTPVHQFLATRGFSVLVPNYRGSTGYGRAYAQALRGNWGVSDVDDCVSGALSLARDARVDGARMAITGGSAGGFTVLQTMIVHPEVFAAGVSMYGVSNQFALCADTHKFEERYTDSLIGPLPEFAARYRERSPEYRASEIRRPLAVFQGADDEVVPKGQSDAIIAALKASGTPHEYHVYEGEGHGWRKSETIDAFLTSVERFLRNWLVYA